VTVHVLNQQTSNPVNGHAKCALIEHRSADDVVVWYDVCRRVSPFLNFGNRLSGPSRVRACFKSGDAVNDGLDLYIE
jgi:hypothetical protein